jgi:cell division control protein 12
MNILESNQVDMAAIAEAAATASPGTGIANLPNQRHKIVAKNGANFTLMVCGKVSLDYSIITCVLNKYIKANRVVARQHLSIHSSQPSRSPKT